MICKLHLTAILALSMVVCANAGWVKDLHILHYENSTGEKGRTVFIYNGKDLPYKAIWELKDGSRWSENLHTFNKRGQLIHKERSFSDSLQSEQSFSYSKEGLLVHESFSRSDGLKGTAHYIYKGDRCKEALCENHLGWFSGRILYYYGNGGRKDSARLEIKGQQIGRIEYRYDPINRLEQETWTFSRGFQQIFRYEYLDRNCIFYNSSNVFLINSCGCLIEKEDYDFNADLQ